MTQTYHTELLSTFYVSWTPMKSQNSTLLHLGPFLLCLSVTWFARFLWTGAVKISWWFHGVYSASLELERAKKNREGELLGEGTLNCYINCCVRKINSPSPLLSPPLPSFPFLSLEHRKVIIHKAGHWHNNPIVLWPTKYCALPASKSILDWELLFSLNQRFVFFLFGGKGVSFKLM